MKKNRFYNFLKLFFLFVLMSFGMMSKADDGNYSAYLFAYFKGEGLAQGEQIYFAVSKDGLHWTDLNEGSPVLTSSLGEKGLRDPFIMRSAEGDKFFVIATDLKIYGNGNWTAAQTSGSKSIMVWESEDLVNWSEQRMCRVAPEGAGCTWAPEAFYDDESGNYIVFWSSKIPNSQNVQNNDNTHRVYYATTKDFRTFSEAKVWIELKNANGRVISAIDATAIKVGDTYYRFKKNEATEAHKQGLPSSGKYIIMEKSKSLLGEWTEIATDMSRISGVEGPTCFKFNNEDKWCLFLDDFGGKGYYPLVSTDLSSGQFTQLASGEYSLPSVMRHGSVINITEEEYYGLLAKYDPNRKSTACLNPAARQQTIEGWGVSLCWWANMCGKWSEDKVNHLVELLTAEDGLNYNIFRYNIGGGDDPSHYNGHMTTGKGKRAEMDGFKASEYAQYDWTKDPGQRKVLQKIKEARPDAIFEAFSNSPPYWMTYSGCSAGNKDANSDNLKPEYYGQFCDYLIDVCKHFKEEYGIEFKTLDPFNEPNTNYWGANGGQEGCHFSPASQVKLIRTLYPKLQQSGLNTVMSACDETSVTTAISELQLYMSEGDIVPMLGQFNVHTYSGNVMDKANLKDLVNKSGLPFWMSETGAGGTGIAGNLSLAQRMFDDLNYLMPQAWIDWQFVEEGNDQWCMVMGNFAAQTYSIVKNYYIRMQVTRFIKQGYTMLMTGRPDLLAALSPDGKELVIVMLNTNTEDKFVDVDLSLFKDVSENVQLYVTNSSKNCERLDGAVVKDGQFSYVLGKQEIATAILSVESGDGVKALQPDVAYMMIPRAATSIVSAASDGGLCLANIALGDSLQRWYFKSLPNGNYMICTKQDGAVSAITDDGSYFLKWSPVKADDISQQFEIKPVGENCFDIISASNGKMFDLEGVNTAVGTKVGVWEGGKAGENAHRQWRILPFPYANELKSGEGTGVVSPQTNQSVYFYGDDDVLNVVNLSGDLLAMRIYSLNGKLLKTVSLKDTFGTIALPTGVYVVEYEQAGSSKSVKVIVD